ncbi:MAG: hypothetical protein INR64_07745 [Caulobacteraceae bacterium]|nr:hypothetical protein [Caulobacter sp.]
MHVVRPKRGAVGLAAAALLVGIPVFFKVGVVMLLPLAEGAARRTGKPLSGAVRLSATCLR